MFAEAMGGDEGAKQGWVRQGDSLALLRPGLLEKQILLSLGTKADPLCSSKKGVGEQEDSSRSPRNPLLGC